MKNLFIFIGILAMFVACADGEIEFLDEGPDGPTPNITDVRTIPDNIPKPNTSNVMEIIRECPNAIACNSTIRNLDEDLIEAAADAIKDQKDKDSDDDYVSPLGAAFQNKILLIP